MTKAQGKITVYGGGKGRGDQGNSNFSPGSGSFFCGGCIERGQQNENKFIIDGIDVPSQTHYFIAS